MKSIGFGHIITMHPWFCKLKEEWNYSWNFTDVWYFVVMLSNAYNIPSII
jgi:hypothetical protein